jgi:hypothetical protein
MREIFNIPMIINKYHQVSPYVVLLANNLKPKIEGSNLKVTYPKRGMRRRLDQYIADNAAVIYNDIRTIDEFFNCDDSDVEALEV